MAIVISGLLFLLVRALVGGEPFGIGFWLTAALFLFVVNPVVSAILSASVSGSRLDSEEMEFHQKFVDEDVPVLQEALRRYRETGHLPEGRFSLTAAKRDLNYLNKLGILGELEQIERLVFARRDEEFKS